MWNFLCALFGLLWMIRAATCAGNCYSEVCKNRAMRIVEAEWKGPQESFQCLLTAVQNDSDCMNLKFHKSKHLPPAGLPLADLKLSAYVHEEHGTKTTAFNLTINNINFQRLITRYQERGDPRSSYCRTIHFHGLEKSEIQPNIFVSCPFTGRTLEERSYWLEYSIIHRDYEYSRKLLFNVPNHRHIEEHLEDLHHHPPFIYADISEIPAVSLHIQPLPPKFNVSTYRVWILNNATGTSETLDLKSPDSESHITQNISMTEGVYHIYVAAIHEKCGNGCVNSTLPVINVMHPARRILIMIISVVWIPPAILYAVYYVYKLYRRKKLTKVGRRPRCLLAYLEGYMAHVDFARNLAEYLTARNVEVMVEALDVEEIANKDSSHWFNGAFMFSDTIIIVTESSDTGDIPLNKNNKNISSEALRLLIENCSSRTKRFLCLGIPDTSDEVPEEARPSRELITPGNLDNLVKYLQDRNFHWNCSDGTVQNPRVVTAMLEAGFPRERQGIPENTDETGLLSSRNNGAV